MWDQHWFGSASPTNAQHVIDTGRWAYTSIDKVTDANATDLKVITPWSNHPPHAAWTFLNCILPWTTHRVVFYNLHNYIPFPLAHIQGAKSLRASTRPMEHESSPISHEKSLRAWIEGRRLGTPGWCMCLPFIHSTPTNNKCVQFGLLLRGAACF